MHGISLRVLYCKSTINKNGMAEETLEGQIIIIQQEIAIV